MPGTYTRPSERELDVIALRDRGIAYKKIAEILGISIDTVSEHVSNLMSKLGAGSSAEAAFQLRSDELEARANRLLDDHEAASKTPV